MFRYLMFYLLSAKNEYFQKNFLFEKKNIYLGIRSKISFFTWWIIYFEINIHLWRFFDNIAMQNNKIFIDHYEDDILVFKKFLINML